MNGIDNSGFNKDNEDKIYTYRENYEQEQNSTSASPHASKNISTKQTTESSSTEREVWGRDIQYLMSLIAMSIGLGNIWRFPFAALDNGGGAFLIPYLIVLAIVGRPIYYLEMIVGQFSSRGSIKVYDMSPIMKGIGLGQVIAVSFIATFYASLMALIGRYLVDSFSNPLPWSYCRPDWFNCMDSKGIIHGNTSNNVQATSSAEFYFVKEVLHEYENIDNGIGIPDWKLTICLAFAWLVIVLTLIRGVKSSGKAAYFLAIFPYVIMIVLLIRSVTLPGARNGILFFLTPQWDVLLKPQVWYAAVTQCFFSLSVCFGNIIMYSSFNKFNHNIYRDVNIITILDTCTSMLAGITIFAVLGHLAHELNISDITSVIKGGPGLAFISYPDAIARFEWVPQVFSVLFFFMLFVLGIGSNMAMASCTMTAIIDQFPKIKHWQAVVGIAICGIAIGLIYVTPGGQFILKIVDFFAVSFTATVLAIAELITIGWIYGVNRLCKDIEFMLNRKTGIYWRLCWGIISPGIIIAIVIYSLVAYEPVEYNGYIYSNGVYALGWILSLLGILQLPIWMFYTIIVNKSTTENWFDTILKCFKPSDNWGPINPLNYQRYQHFYKLNDNTNFFKKPGFFRSIKRNIFG